MWVRMYHYLVVQYKYIIHYIATQLICWKINSLSKHTEFICTGA